MWLITWERVLSLLSLQRLFLSFPSCTHRIRATARCGGPRVFHRRRMTGIWSFTVISRTGIQRTDCTTGLHKIIWYVWYISTVSTGFVEAYWRTLGSTTQRQKDTFNIQKDGIYYCSRRRCTTHRVSGVGTWNVQPRKIRGTTKVSNNTWTLPHHQHYR